MICQVQDKGNTVFKYTTESYCECKTIIENWIEYTKDIFYHFKVIVLLRNEKRIKETNYNKTDKRFKKIGFISSESTTILIYFFNKTNLDMWL